MCKKYIDDTVENRIIQATTSLREILFPENKENVGPQGHMSVRDARKKLLSARSQISHALRIAGDIERVRYVRNGK